MPTYYIGGIFASSNDLFHYGVVGMKWGVRRYQNPDGSYTAAGKKRYKTFSQLKKDYPGLDYEPTFPETDRPGGLTDQEIDAAYKKYEEDPRYNVLSDSSSRLDKKVREDIGDWYMSQWKSPTIKRLYDVKESKLSAIREINYSDYTKKMAQLADEYDKKAISEIPKYSKFQKKKYDAAKKEAFAKSWTLLQKDPRYIELQKQSKDANKLYDLQVSEIRRDFNEKMLGEVLKELGYQNTKEARAYIYSTILWD